MLKSAETNLNIIEIKFIFVSREIGWDSAPLRTFTLLICLLYYLLQAFDCTEHNNRTH